MLGLLSLFWGQIDLSGQIEGGGDISCAVTLWTNVVLAEHYCEVTQEINVLEMYKILH